MRPALPRLALVTTLVLCAGCASIEQGGAGQAAGLAPVVERPVLRSGDQWIRSDGVYELIRMEDDVYVFANDSGREWFISRDLTIAGAGTTRFDPPPRLEWPLQVGRTTYSTGILRSRTDVGAPPAGSSTGPKSRRTRISASPSEP